MVESRNAAQCGDGVIVGFATRYVAGLAPALLPIEHIGDGPASGEVALPLLSLT